MFLALLLLGCADPPAPVAPPTPRGSDAIPAAQLRASAGLAAPCLAVRSTLMEAGGQRLHDRVGQQLRTRYPDAPELHAACEALADADAEAIIAHAEDPADATSASPAPPADDADSAHHLAHEPNPSEQP